MNVTLDRCFRGAYNNAITAIQLAASIGVDRAKNEPAYLAYFLQKDGLFDSQEATEITTNQNPSKDLMMRFLVWSISMIAEKPKTPAELLEQIIFNSGMDAGQVDILELTEEQWVRDLFTLYKQNQR